MDDRNNTPPIMKIKLVEQELSLFKGEDKSWKTQHDANAREWKEVIKAGFKNAHNDREKLFEGMNTLNVKLSALQCLSVKRELNWLWKLVLTILGLVVGIGVALWRVNI